MKRTTIKTLVRHGARALRAAKHVVDTGRSTIRDVREGMDFAEQVVDTLDAMGKLLDDFQAGRRVQVKGPPVHAKLRVVSTAPPKVRVAETKAPDAETMEAVRKLRAVGST